MNLDSAVGALSLSKRRVDSVPTAEFGAFLRRGALVPMLLLTVMLGTARAAPAQTASSGAPTGVYSAAALFNKGNAFARNGQTGLAILNYERALLLAPGDSDIAANLHFVRAKAGIPEPAESWATQQLTSVSPNALAWLGSAGLVLVGLGVLSERLFPRRRRTFRSLTLAGCVLAATTVGGAIVMWPRVHEAVVISRKAPARTSPVAAAEEEFALREGETVTVRAVRPGFALVQTPAGRLGWVARNQIEDVVPRN
jgi:hypothetical protein